MYKVKMGGMREGMKKWVIEWEKISKTGEMFKLKAMHEAVFG